MGGGERGERPHPGRAQSAGGRTVALGPCRRESPSGAGTRHADGAAGTRQASPARDGGDAGLDDHATSRSPAIPPPAWPRTGPLGEVWARHPAPGCEALHGVLWTREAATPRVAGQEVVRQYPCRWPIEASHVPRQSGGRLEALRLETWDRLDKAIVLYTSVAARLVALRDRAAQEPDAPAPGWLSADACAVCGATGGPRQAGLRLTRGQAVWGIGRRGGHLNRQRDGMPGVRTLWRGRRDWTLLVEGWRVARRLDNRGG